MKNKIDTSGKAKQPLTADWKRTYIVLSVLVAALLIALIPIIILIVKHFTDEPDKGHDIPEDILSGSYVFNLPPSFDKFSFSEGGKVTRVLYTTEDNDGVDGEGGLPTGEYKEITNEYSYEIRQISDNLYDMYLKNDKGEVVDTLSLSVGSFDRYYYRCETDVCVHNDANDGLGASNRPVEEGVEYCNYHPTSKIYKETVTRDYLYIDEEFYYRLK